MGLHTDLKIHTAARKLLGAVTESTIQMRRDVKQSLGKMMIDESLDITTLIQRANMDKDKSPHLNALLEKKCRVEVLLQVSLDGRFISPGLYGTAIRFAQSVGQQAIGWRRNSQERQLQDSQGDSARA